MTSYSFYARGNPKGQPRARAVAFGGRARLYDPGNANDWKTCIKAAAHEAGATNARLSGPIALNLRVYFPRPKSHYKTGKNAHLLRDDAPNRHISKPDDDNVKKAIQDALNDAFVWGDDCQVCDSRIIKLYGSDPGAWVTIKQIPDEPTHPLGDR